MNTDKLTKAVNNLTADLAKVQGSNPATADVLIMFASELDKALMDMVKQLDGDSAMMEGVNSMAMEAALFDVVREVEPVNDSWRLFDEGIDIYSNG